MTVREFLNTHPYVKIFDYTWDKPDGDQEVGYVTKKELEDDPIICARTITNLDTCMEEIMPNEIMAYFKLI